MLKRDLKETGCKDMELIHVAHDRVQWQALVDMVKNLGLHRKWGFSWVAKIVLNSQGGMCSMEFVSWKQAWNT